MNQKMNELVLKKNTYQIETTVWKITLSTDKEIDFLQLMKSKAVVQLWDEIINFAFVARVRKDDGSDKLIDTALARAKTLWPWFRDVAIRRCTRYEETQGHKITLEKLQSRMESFTKNPSEFPEYNTLLDINTQANNEKL